MSLPAQSPSQVIRQSVGNFGIKNLELSPAITKLTPNRYSSSSKSSKPPKSTLTCKPYPQPGVSPIPPQPNPTLTPPTQPTHSRNPHLAPSPSVSSKSEPHPKPMAPPATSASPMPTDAERQAQPPRPENLVRPPKLTAAQRERLASLERVPMELRVESASV